MVLVEAAPAPTAGHGRDPGARRADLAATTWRRSSRSSTASPATRAARDPEPDPPAELLDEGVFRAARFGVDAELPDADGRLRPVAELLDDALAPSRGTRASWAARTSSTRLRGLLERGGGAGRQRAAHAIGGIGALLRDDDGAAPPA